STPHERCLRSGGVQRSPGKDGVLAVDHRSTRIESGHTDRSERDARPSRDPAMQRRDRRRLAVAVISTVVPIPLLIVEVAPGADAPPAATPTASVADELPADEADDTTDDGAVTEAAAADEVASDPTPRAFGMVTGDE